MGLAEQLDKRIKSAAAVAANLLSRGEPVDDATLALAVASGETAATLAAKVQEKIDKRTAAEAPAAVAPSSEVDLPAVPVAIAEAVPEESKEKRSHHKKGE